MFKLYSEKQWESGSPGKGKGKEGSSIAKTSIGDKKEEVWRRLGKKHMAVR